MTATTLVTYDDTKHYELLADCNENQEHYIILYAWKGLSSYIAGLVGEMFVLTNQTVLSSPFARSLLPLSLPIHHTPYSPGKTRIEHRHG